MTRGRTYPFPRCLKVLCFYGPKENALLLCINASANKKEIGTGMGVVGIQTSKKLGTSHVISLSRKKKDLK